MTDAPITDPHAPPWKCFFCGEIFGDAITASRHFGEDIGSQPGCIDPLRKDEKARLRKLQLARYEERRARQDRDKVQDQADAYHAQCAELERLFGKGRSTAHQAWRELDSMEGRALAAEEKVRHLRSALGALAAEVGGCWEAFQLELRQVVSNTNYVIIQEALTKARAVLEPEAAKPAAEGVTTQTEN